MITLVKVGNIIRGENYANGKVIVVREMIIEWYMNVEYIKVKEELTGLKIRRIRILEYCEYETARYPEEYIPALACTASSKLCGTS